MATDYGYLTRNRRTPRDCIRETDPVCIRTVRNGIDLLHEGSTITLLYSMDGSGSIGNLTFPVTAVLGAGTSIAISEDELRGICKRHGHQKKSAPEDATDDHMPGDEEEPGNEETPSGETQPKARQSIQSL